MAKPFLLCDKCEGSIFTESDIQFIHFDFVFALQTFLPPRSPGSR